MSIDLKQIVDSLKTSDFFKDIKKKNGEVFIVGGLIRDSLIEQKSKDVDILVTGIPFFELGSILDSHGTTDIVGKSFGVIKFKCNQLLDFGVIDVALPRTEIKSGEGHQGFDVTVDHNLPIESDLERRDFTMNAIALDVETGAFVDPFEGQKDIADKKIKMVNSEAFSDDPLRMLRAIQFASRFPGFEIEKETWENIKKNALKIKEISGERILTELDKVVEKNGDIDKAINLLVESAIFHALTGFYLPRIQFDKNKRTRLDFLFELTSNFLGDCGEFFKKSLKGDEETAKALTEAFKLTSAVKIHDATTQKRGMMAAGLKKSMMLLDFSLFPPVLNSARLEFKMGLFPKTVKELTISGGDILRLTNLKPGPEIGRMLDTIFAKVLSGEVANEKKVLEAIIMEQTK